MHVAPAALEVSFFRLLVRHGHDEALDAPLAHVPDRRLRGPNRKVHENLPVHLEPRAPQLEGMRAVRTRDLHLEPAHRPPHGPERPRRLCKPPVQTVVVGVPAEHHPLDSVDGSEEIPAAERVRRAAEAVPQRVARRQHPQPRRELEGEPRVRVRKRRRDPPAVADHVVQVRQPPGGLELDQAALRRVAPRRARAGRREEVHQAEPVKVLAELEGHANRQRLGEHHDVDLRRHAPREVLGRDGVRGLGRGRQGGPVDLPRRGVEHQASRQRRRDRELERRASRDLRLDKAVCVIALPERQAATGHVQLELRRVPEPPQRLRCVVPHVFPIVVDVRAVQCPNHVLVAALAHRA
eukprot:1957865-Rhodomonas_salina.1